MVPYKIKSPPPPRRTSLRVFETYIIYSKKGFPLEIWRYVPISAFFKTEISIGRYTCRSIGSIYKVGTKYLVFYFTFLRWPGSAHDSRIFDASSLKLRCDQEQLPGILLGKHICFSTSMWSRPPGTNQNGWGACWMWVSFKSQANKTITLSLMQHKISGLLDSNHLDRKKHNTSANL